jgi:hypothetical protein
VVVGDDGQMGPAMKLVVEREVGGAFAMGIFANGMQVGRMLLQQEKKLRLRLAFEMAFEQKPGRTDGRAGPRPR